MAVRPKTVCRHPGCRTLVDVSGFCEKHRKQHGWYAGGRSDKRGYGGEWRKLREEVLDRDQGLCQECKRQGRIMPGTDVDHIVPKAQGGSDSLSNLQVLCRECHRLKTKREKRGNAHF